MAEADADGELPGAARAGRAQAGRAARGRRLAARFAAALGLVALAALGAAWIERDRLADRLIERQLAALKLRARYDIVSIGPRRQVLANVVVGDPAHPDLTIARLETTLSPRFGLPGLARVTLVAPRLAGSYTRGRLSFGALDPVLFGGPRAASSQLPPLDLTIVDGRALLRTDLGAPVAIRLSGAGGLRGGFAGRVALDTSSLAARGCRAERPTASGALSVRDGRPRFAGPLRADALACGGDRLRLAAPALAADLRFDPTLDGIEGTLRLRSGAIAGGATRAGGASGETTLTFRRAALTARYRIALAALATPPGGVRSLAAEGLLRAEPGSGAARLEATIRAAGLMPGAGLDRALAGAERASAGSFAAPLLARLRGGLAREVPGSALAAELTAHAAGGAFAVVANNARWTGRSGAVLLRVPLAGWGRRADATRFVAGSFDGVGADLPRIHGELRGDPEGATTLTVTMTPYAAGPARLALPTLAAVRRADGTIGLAGRARIDGPLANGAARGLALPIAGDWSPRAGLTLWRRCADVRFDMLRLADLTLDARALTLCPPRGGAIVRVDARGTRIAADAPALALTGRLGATPIRIASGPIGVAMPGVLTARAVDVALGPPATASRFEVATLDARIGREVAGRFAGARVRLAAVPLDLADSSGEWRYAGGRLTIARAAFRLLDRASPARFNPLVARDAALTLADDAVVADAALREPNSDRVVVRARIVHDLARTAGHADLAVAALAFDKALQPAALTPLALGVVADVAGVVRGASRVDWSGERVTSNGAFATDALDLAAAFGPVKGVAGRIVFTDLLDLVTAPAQQVRLGSINPGIEVDDGVLTFQLKPGRVLAVAGARWPFMGGTLTLQPVTMTLGATETRRYTLSIAGLDAALFAQRMDLGNLGATGTFDGTLPLVFDVGGGRIEGGRLTSRPPGGNVSYVGALTYKDLSAMANFAFDALKSLDFTRMDVAMNGPLDGEIVTRLRFVGVRQGARAKRNFLTERIARLPLQFNVNLRAPFFQLVTSFKSLYDPAYVRDPRAVGLLGPDGRPIAPRATIPIQPPASGTMR